MSKEQNLNLEGLEEATVAATVETPVKEKKEKKQLTAEDVAAIVEAVEKIKMFGVSDSFARVLGLVPVWHLSKEEVASHKEEVINAFGGSEAFKNYIDGDFQEELSVVAGMSKAVSVLNNIKAFYARREGKATSKKVKTQVVTIAGEQYNVSVEFLASIADKASAEKRELLLAHEATTKVEALEII